MLIPPMCLSCVEDTDQSADIGVPVDVKDGFSRP